MITYCLFYAHDYYDLDNEVFGPAFRQYHYYYYYYYYYYGLQYSQACRESLGPVKLTCKLTSKFRPETSLVSSQL